MNNKDKRALYETIMKSVAKTVKKNINENFGDTSHTKEIIIVSAIDSAHYINSEYTKAFIDNETAENYFKETFSALCETCGANCSCNDIEEINAALDDGYYEFNDGAIITINNITLVE